MAKGNTLCPLEMTDECNVNVLFKKQLLASHSCTYILKIIFG
jgi:hypothetical protein